MKQAYICNHCNRIGNKELMTDHEIRCSHNPENRHCFTCEFYKQTSRTTEKCTVLTSVQRRYLGVTSFFKDRMKHRDIMGVDQVTIDCNYYKKEKNVQTI